MIQHLQKLADENRLLGRIEDLPNEIYHHPNCPGISSTRLSVINRSISHYLYSLANPKGSRALDFGSAFHDAILLPELFEQKYFELPDVDGRTKEGKAILSKLKEENKDRIILMSDEYHLILQMRERIYRNPDCSSILSRGESEISHFWREPETGILCKFRPDKLRVDDSIIIDLKTTVNCHEKSFQRSIIDYGYYRSAAFYLDGASNIYSKKFSTFLIIAIEKEPPFDLGLYVLDEKTIQKGREQYLKDLKKYSEFLNSSNKDLFDEPTFKLLGLPDWMIK